jgi:hypothetical protein
VFLQRRVKQEMAMGNRMARFVGAALLLASAGCIVEREQVVAPDREQVDNEDYEPPPPPRRHRAPRPPPPPSLAEDAGVASSAPPPGAPNPQITNSAKAAEQELDRESEQRGRPVISNLDADGYPIPGTTGDADAGPGGDDEAMQGAPGANASPEELSRAWPGARPVDNAALDGSGNNLPAPGGAPTALPYSAPGGSASTASTDASDESVPPPGTELDTSAFQRPLRGYGRWVDTPDQGRVWIPYVDDDWQPYSDGTWSDTEYGWTFTSYDPWGWAVWHYGTWGFRAGIGWYWVPGRVWGPAWVSWRWGGGYAVWRPLAPWGAWGARWGNRGWVGVPAARFTQPLHAGIIMRGPAIGVAIARSQPLAGPVAHPVAGGSFGPPVSGVAQATGRPVVARPAARVITRANLAARSAAAQAGRASAREAQAARASAPPAGGSQMRENRAPAARPNARQAAPGAGARPGNARAAAPHGSGGHHGGGHGGHSGHRN